MEDAGKAALATARAALRRSLLPPGGVNGGGETAGNGPLSDRVASLTGRLEEKAAARVLEEKSEFDRTCTASMMALGTEVRGGGCRDGRVPLFRGLVGKQASVFVACCPFHFFVFYKQES